MLRTGLLVLLETEWVLRTRYKLNKGEILSVFSDLPSAVDMNLRTTLQLKKRSLCGRTQPPSLLTV
jgi:hypothetical protein